MVGAGAPHAGGVGAEPCRRAPSQAGGASVVRDTWVTGEPNPLSCVVEGFINAHYGSRRHRLSKVCWSVMLSSRVRRPGAATLVSALTAAAMTLTPRAAAQDDDFRAIAGIGPGFAPQYEGANEYRPIPFIIARARWGARRFIGTDGTGVRADALKSRFIEAGPAVSFRFARDAGVDDARIAELTPVDRSVEVGAFLALNFPFPVGGNKKDALTVDAMYLSDIAGGHGGDVFRVSLRYRGLVTQRLVLQAGPFATHGSSDFMDAYYSVNGEQASTLSVAPFAAEGGFKDVGARVSARYTFNKPWAITGSLGVKRYIGDAVDSPVVADFGSAVVAQGGVALTRSF